MKKHIIGLALFSFIVSAAAIVYGLFSVSEIAPVYTETVVVSAPQYSTTKSCWKMKRDSRGNSVEVKQAVFDLQTKQFNWELSAPADVNEPVDLHFFSKDNGGTRYIASEQVGSAFSGDGVLRFSNSYVWLNKRKSFDNLYVIAQFASESKNYSENYQVYGNKYQPKFDAAKATAVTVDYGE